MFIGRQNDELETLGEMEVEDCMGSLFQRPSELYPGYSQDSPVSWEVIIE